MKLAKADQFRIARLMRLLSDALLAATGCEVLAVLALGEEGILDVIAPEHLRVPPAAMEAASTFCDAIAIANNCRDVRE